MLGPVLLIVVGVLFLLRNIFPEFAFHKMWPVILIVIGVAKIIEYLQGSTETTEQKKEGQ